jgi:L-2-hydroxyglutarate oxidase LhgO
MTERVEAVVIGAGVVGLACARALARAGMETLVLERHDAFGTEISARNSEVIHAGIYYPANSLKANLCVAGRAALYRFCDDYGVGHRRCGKLIVATHADQEVALASIRKHAETNGVSDIQVLAAEQARALEPEVRCSAALFSPSTGIIDSHSLMLALLGDAERHGASLVLRSPVLSGRIATDGIVLKIGGDEPTELCAGIVVNSAGLSATAIAASLGGFPAASVPPAYLAKGNYFALAGKAPFSRLVYPVPEPGGLGVHLTLDLAGQARFGPDVEWIDAIDYAVNPERCLKFYDQVRKYWPGLRDGALHADYAGIRPKISGPADPAADFVIRGPKDHGVAGLVNLFGIESPGLTSCLAIAERVCFSLRP